MKNIQRSTQVISISVPQNVARKLDQARNLRGQTRSAFIASMIDQQTEDQRWQRIYAKGQKTAKKFKITSEEDIDRILHESKT